MIDTIHIRINILIDLIQGKNYIQRLLDIITLIEDGTKHATGNRYYIGKFHNFIVEIDGNNVSIKGSLAKYYQGDNLKFFGRAELYLALKLLSSELGLNVERGRISRIDVADNLFLSQKPKKYIELLKGIGKAEGHWRKGTYYIERSCLSLAFYDKKKELLANDVHTYNGLFKSDPNSNILRYEVRFERKLSHEFKFGKIKVALLHSSTFLKALAESWLKQYLLITKVKQESFKEITVVAQVKKLIMFKGIEAMGGLEKVNKLIDENRNSNQWGYMPAYNLKRRLQAISNNQFLVEDSPLIEELDAAIADSNIVKFFLNI